MWLHHGKHLYEMRSIITLTPLLQEELELEEEPLQTYHLS